MAALSELNARDAWNEVASTIAGDQGVIASAEDRFVAEILAGDPMRGLERELTLLLSSLDWRWELYDRWTAIFAEWGAFPYMWRKHEKSVLVVHTACMAAYRNMRLADEGTSVTRSRFLILSVSPTGDEIEDRVSSQFLGQIEAGDYSIVPPFFPGDRTGLGYRRKARQGYRLRTMTTINAKDIHARDMAESSEYREAYQALAAEFANIDQSIREQRVLPTPHPATAPFSRKGRRGR